MKREDFHIKDKWAQHLQELHEKDPTNNLSPNWVSTEKSQKIVADFRDKYPEVEITFDDEHFLVKSNGVIHNIPRWLEIPHSSDGKSIDRYVAVESEIERVISGGD